MKNAMREIFKGDNGEVIIIVKNSATEEDMKNIKAVYPDAKISQEPSCKEFKNN